MIGSRTDAELLAAVRGGDVESLGELFQRHHAMVHALCYRLTMDADAADDLVQETFLRVLRYAAGYRGDARFSTWLFRIARNACVDHLDRARRDSEVSHRWLVERRMEQSGSSAAPDHTLERALAMLPPDRREALVLSRYHELSYDELGVVLGCTAGAARVRVHRAMQELRDIYRTLEQTDHGLRSDVRAND